MKWSSILSLGVSAMLGTKAQAASSSSGGDLPEIEIVGNRFFYSNNGSQFFIKGVAYQSDVSNGTVEKTFDDPLADADACKRDVKLLQELNTNAIRVYAINTSLKHDECIKTFADAGIYIIADLSEPGLSINRDDPKWNVNLLNRYTTVVDALAKHSNVLGFFAGNEVANEKNNTAASAFVKAAVRDVKAYIKQKKYRSIPVGYSMNDDSDIRLGMSQYFACGDERAKKADFLGMNNYEWCGSSSLSKSGWSERIKEFEKFGIPFFWSEYGCNEVQPRKFEEVEALYSKDAAPISGGIVYMYQQEANNYGLVKVSGSNAKKQEDFAYLSKAMASVTMSPIKSSEAKATASTVDCPKGTGSKAVGAAATKLPPTPNHGNCQCVSDAAACVVADKVDSDDYGKLFGYLCSKISCDGINANGTTGEYGSFFLLCSKGPTELLLNAYYEKNGKKDKACDFEGSASVADSPKTEGVCKTVLKEAGTAGTGAVSASATGSMTGGAEAADTNAATGSSSSTGADGKSGANRGAMVTMCGVIGAFVAGVAMVL